jgi:hypothetical protein
VDGYVTNLCVVKSALILFVAATMVIVLLWLRPYGVLSQQVAVVVVYGLMALAAALVIASGQTNVALMESVAAIVFSVASGVVLLQACVDLAVTALEGREALHQTDLGLKRRREMRAEEALLPPPQPPLLCEPDTEMTEEGTLDGEEEGLAEDAHHDEEEPEMGMLPGEMGYIHQVASAVLGRELVEDDLVSLATDEEEEFNLLFKTDHADPSMDL